MGDWFATLVVADVDSADAPAVAETVLRWLIDNGVVLDTPNPQCVLGGEGYPPGPNAPYDVPTNLSTNGMTVKIGRRAYNLGQGGYDAFCPNCSAAADTVFDVIRAWEKGDSDDRYTCPSCEHRCRIAELRWPEEEPLLGELAFEFWNWPPAEDWYLPSNEEEDEDTDLVSRLEELTGRRLLVGHAKL